MAEDGDLDRNEFIQLNLISLVNCTVLNVEVVNHLVQKGLITTSEEDYFRNGMFGNAEKVTKLYTETTRKWNDGQLKKFIDILKQLGHLGAYEIFTAEGAEVFLTRDEVYCLKEQMNKVKNKNGGGYEGITFEDEEAAKVIVKNFEDGSISSWREFASSKCLEERRAIVPALKKFLTGITTGSVWYNKKKPRLPQNYIERKFQKYCDGHDDVDDNDDDDDDDDDDVDDDDNDDDEIKPSGEKRFIELIYETTDDLALLADPPGMGKSSALTKLEMDIREIKELSRRIIVRNNLNQFCGILKTISTQQVTLESFIRNFASFIPLEQLKNSSEFKSVPVFILLDGLDEVLPEYEDAMLNILEGLLNSSTDPGKLFLVRLVLTTRSHLRNLIEDEFEVQAYSLCPLRKNDQIDYIFKSLKTKIPSIEIARNLINNLPSKVQTLLSNPLMLHLYCEICSDEVSAEVIDIYSLYSMFVDRKHWLYSVEKEMADPALPSTIKRWNKLLPTNLPIYNMVTLYELASETHVNQILEHDEEGHFTEKLTKEELDDILSYGLVVIREEELKFKHRSFPEYFWAKLIVETKCDQLRNSLFGFGYERGNLIATLVACKLPKKAICDVVRKGWTKFVPNGASLARYQDENGFLIEHILENTIIYADECSRKNQLLVADLCEEKLFFSWLNEKVEQDKKKWLEQILFHDSMCEVIAALVFSGDSAILKFLETWWPPGNGEDQIKQLVRKCPSPVFIAIKEKYNKTIHDCDTYTELLYERMRRWLSCEDLNRSARDLLENDDNRTKFNFLSEPPDLARFVASALSRDGILRYIPNAEARIFDVFGFRFDHVSRIWGEEFFPKRLLRFRYKFGTFKGKSLFASAYERVPHELMDRLCSEIEECVDDAAQVILDDEDFRLVHILETDIRRCEMGMKSCPHLPQQSECQLKKHLTSHRIKLVKDLLARVDFIKFFEKKLSWQCHNLCYLIAYGRLDSAQKWKEVIALKEIDPLWSKLSNETYVRIVYKGFDSNKLFGCLLLSALNIQDCPKENKKLTRAPFELVVEWLNNLSYFIKDTFSEILTRLNKFELSELARNKTENPSLLIELPNVWEVMFSPNGLVHKTHLQSVEENYWDVGDVKDVVTDIKLGAFKNFLSCCSVGQVLDGIRNAFHQLNGEDVVKTYLEEKGNLEAFFEYCEWTPVEKTPSVAQCFVSAMVRFCLDVFEGKLEWIERIEAKDLVPFIVAGEKVACSELVSYVEQIVLNRVNSKGNQSLLVTFFEQFHCNRPCDYYRLLKILPEFKHKIPRDYENHTKVFPSYRNCLFHVWVEMFGEEETLRQTGTFDVWGISPEFNNDGELLHIAVQIGSLRGVERNAWPGLLTWKDKRKGQTALEKAKDKWGSGHEITRFLKTRSEYLFHAGCKDNNCNTITQEIGDHLEKLIDEFGQKYRKLFSQPKQFNPT